MRHIDHVVVAVRHLDAAAAFYRRLGFQPGARNRHPWGTENHIIQFASSFIELISPGPAAPAPTPHQPRRFSFAAFLHDYLQTREGLAMLVLSTPDARSDAARFAETGIGDFEPFFFERTATRPDGSPAPVAFTLAFAADPSAPLAGFFVCRQHFPENFWNPRFQAHANSAADIAAVTLASPHPERHAAFLARFTGAPVERLPDSRLRFSLERSRIEIVPAPAPPPMLASFSLRVPALGPVIARLNAESIPFAVSGDALVLSPETCFGLELRFEPSAV